MTINPDKNDVEVRTNIIFVYNQMNPIYVSR